MKAVMRPYGQKTPAARAGLEKIEKRVGKPLVRKPRAIMAETAVAEITSRTGTLEEERTPQRIEVCHQDERLVNLEMIEHLWDEDHMALIRLRTYQLDVTLKEMEGVILTRGHPVEWAAMLLMIVIQKFNMMRMMTENMRIAPVKIIKQADVI